jgi:hypothetical protein
MEPGSRPVGRLQVAATVTRGNGRSVSAPQARCSTGGRTGGGRSDSTRPRCRSAAAWQNRCQVEQAAALGRRTTVGRPNTDLSATRELESRHSLVLVLTGPDRPSSRRSVRAGPGRTRTPPSLVALLRDSRGDHFSHDGPAETQSASFAAT